MDMGSVADVTASPRPVPTAEHSAALTKRSGGKTAKTPKKQQLPLSAWMLYRPRFIFTADICGSFASFGVIAAQLNSVSIIPHLASTESIAAALVYDIPLSAHLEELSSARSERPAAVVDSSELLSVGATRLKLQGIDKAAKPSATADPPVKNPMDTPPPGKPPWVAPKEGVHIETRSCEAS